MKKLWCLLYVGTLLAGAPCRGQSPPAADAVPLMFVYVETINDNALPRIVLGLEKPALKIGAFEKCAVISTAYLQRNGLAVQLKPDDVKTLSAAINATAASRVSHPPAVRLWFATPENKVLGFIDTEADHAAGNILETGVLEFESGAQDQGAIATFLTEKLHPN